LKNVNSIPVSIESKKSFEKYYKSNSSKKEINEIRTDSSNIFFKV
jgi:hypothetical protein